MGFTLNRDLYCCVSNTDFQYLRCLLKIFPKSPVDPDRIMKYLLRREPQGSSGPTFLDKMNLSLFFISSVNLEALLYEILIWNFSALWC